MQKRGQVTIFIVLGIVVILAAVVLVFMISSGNDQNYDAEGKVITDPEVKNVDSFIRDCLLKSSQEALFYLGYTGGNVGYFPKSFSYDSYDVAYYYYEGVSYMPSYEDVTDNILGKYVEQNIVECINDFDDFENLKIEYVNPVTDVVIAQESVVFKINFPVSVFRGGQKIDLGPEFRSEINARLKDMLDITNNIVANQIKNELFVHWDYMTDKTKDNFGVTAYTEEDNTIVYRIIDEENNLFEEPYIFQFANKYYIGS